jgi:hypothetical protein
MKFRTMKKQKCVECKGGDEDAYIGFIRKPKGKISHGRLTQ